MLTLFNPNAAMQEKVAGRAPEAGFMKLRPTLRAHYISLRL